MTRFLRLALLILVTVPATTVLAEWSGGVEGGTTVRNGDSATRIRVNASLEERPLSHHLYAEWIRATQNSYELGYKPKYWFTNKVYGFGEGRIRIDDALSIDRDTLILSGAGIQLVATNSRYASFEAGVGYRLIDYAPAVELEEVGEGVATLRGRASQVLSDLFKLELDSDVFKSESLMESRVEVGVSTRLGQGAIKLSYKIRRVDSNGFNVLDDADSAVTFTLGF